MKAPEIELGNLSRKRQIEVLKIIYKSETIEYKELEYKVDALDMKIFHKPFHLESVMWDLVEEGFVVDNYADWEDSYSITSKGKNIAKSILTSEFQLKEGE